MALHPADFASIDLCAGAHGLGLGLDIAVPLAFPGFRARSVCHVEREAFAAATLVGHMEAGTLDPAAVWSDLATFDGRPWRGRVHCVTSGDPCQPNSVAGKRRGAEDDRFLADQVVRVVDEVRPLCVFRENVPGNADGQLGVLVPALEGLGYRVECGIFSSAETGNSHGRRRLFILAWRADFAGRLHARQWRPGEGAADAGGVGGRLGDTAHDQRRGELEKEGTGRGRARPSGTGSGMGDTPRERRGQGRPEHAREQGRSAAAGTGGELADAGNEGSPSTRGDSRSQETFDATRSCSGELADADGFGRRPKGDCRVASDDALQSCGGMDAVPAIIPGPSDPRWPALLAGRPELAPAIDAAEAERLLCRGFDALANRVDRLRLLGNGVDPVAAAYAFLCLDARHRAAGLGADEPVVRVAA